MAQFEARTSVRAGRVVVALVGEADLAVRRELTGALLAAVAEASAATESSATVVVDLGGLSFLDSSGLHGLITAYQAAKERDVRLYAVNAKGVVAQVLRLTGVAELLQAPSDV